MRLFLLWIAFLIYGAVGFAQGLRSVAVQLTARLSIIEDGPQLSPSYIAGAEQALSVLQHSSNDHLQRVCQTYGLFEVQDLVSTRQFSILLDIEDPTAQLMLPGGTGLSLTPLLQHLRSDGLNCIGTKHSEGVLELLIEASEDLNMVYFTDRYSRRSEPLAVLQYKREADTQVKDIQARRIGNNWIITFYLPQPDGACQISEWAVIDDKNISFVGEYLAAY